MRFPTSDELIQDVCLALRGMRKNPGFTALAVVLLAAGIGANTATFSVLDRMLLRALPVAEPESLVVVNVQRPGTQSGAPTRFSYLMLEELSASTRAALDGLFTWQLYSVALDTDGDPDAAQAVLVSGDYFPALDVPARIGRMLGPEDNRKDDAQAVMVISDGLWERRFARDPSVVGRVMRVNAYPVTIIGVAPASFFGVDIGVAPDLWMPIRLMSQISLPGTMLDNRAAIWLPAMARLKPGVSAQAAVAVVQPAYRQIQETQGVAAAQIERQRLQLLPGQNGTSRLRQQFAAPVVVIMILVLLILGIACANLASLLLARALARTKEMAIRVAIGADRWRLTRQLLTESFVLTALGTAAGILLAGVCVRVFVAALPAMRDFQVEIDLRVLAFTMVVSVFTALVFGLVPMWTAWRVDVTPTLKDEMSSLGKSAGRAGLRRALVVAQIAFTLVLLFVASLFVSTLRNLRTTEIGLRTEQVLQLAISAGQGELTPSQVRAEFERIGDEVRGLPGIRSAAFAGSEMLSGKASRMDVFPPGYQRASDEDVFSIFEVVDPNFFRTLGIPILQGRDFGPADTAEAPRVIILNEAAARFFFPSQSPLQQRVGVGGRPELEIIGVVGNTKFRDLREPTARIVYLPFSQTNWPSARTLYVNTDANPMVLAASIRERIRATAKNALIRDVKTLSDQVDDSLAQERVTAWLSAFFGLLALLIATLGLYGLMTYTVSRRTREIGLRMALGALPGTVVRMVLRESLSLAGAGALLGVIAVLVVGNLLASLLYGVTARDPSAMVVAVGILLGTAALASYLPARRAAAIDPLRTLRHEQ